MFNQLDNSKFYIRRGGTVYLVKFKFSGLVIQNIIFWIVEEVYITTNSSVIKEYSGEKIILGQFYIESVKKLRLRWSITMQPSE